MQRSKRLRFFQRKGRVAATVAVAAAAALGVALLTVPDHDSPGRADSASKHTAVRLLDESSAQKRAQATGKPVEVSALTTATDITYAQPDGTYDLTTSTRPVRAMDNGLWKKIDTDLVKTKNGWTAQRVNVPVVFSPGTPHQRASRSAHRAALQTSTGTASTVLATMKVDGHELTMTWPGTLPAPVVDGPRALYESVLPGVDLLMTARDQGFSNVLIVHNATAAASPELARRTYGFSSPDLTFHLDSTTNTLVARDADGKETAVAPTPYMWDSAGKPAVTEGSDPQPANPTDEPTPGYSEEPGAPVSDNPSGADSEDTAAPEPAATASTPNDGSSSASADPASFNRAAASSAHIRQALFSAEGQDLTTDEVLALPGLAGPEPGTHDAVADATLSGDNTLAVVPDQDLLTNDHTVYPVFIDPSVSSSLTSWTTAYEPLPSSSFWNGTNFNDGTDTARVGYESTTRGLSRSFFALKLSSKIKGASVSSAYFYAKETYSWSCSAREVQLWHTTSISSKTTWNNQPSWQTEIDSKNTANGYKSSSCPDEYVKFSTTSIAQDAADAGWTTLTLGMKVPKADEGDAYAWKKFASEDPAPYMKITYNHKPKEPTKLTLAPGGTCDTSSPYRSVGASDLTFAATSSDADGDLKYLDLEVWQSGSTTKLYDSNLTADANGHASTTIDGIDGTSSKFLNGKTYYWRVRAIDSTGAASTYAPPGTGNCGFVYDATKPTSPEVTSTDFPEDTGSDDVWSKKTFGTLGCATFTANGSKDTVEYDYSFNSSRYDHKLTVSAGASKQDCTLKPPVAGPNMLYARAVDSAGNTSEPRKYLLYVTPSPTADAAGDVTGDEIPDLYLIDGNGNLRMYPASNTGDIHVSLPAAHNNGVNLEGDTGDEETTTTGYWTAEDDSPALITHNGDFLPGDGIQDIVARMPDGKLYIYRGDGYGSVDISQRTEVLLPSNAPSPADLTQILAIGDYNNDKRPDMLAVAGTELWAFTGYTGGSFTTATLMTAGSWDDRQLVNVGDVNGDGAVDLVYRTFVSNRLLIRYGIKNGTNGTTLASLSSAAGSSTGVDTQYAAGWDTATYTLITGTADVNGDGIPDIWARKADGSVVFFPCTKTGVGTPVTVISSGWETKKSFG